MAHGLPIVTTPVFGIPEQVRENLNALFYAPGDVGTLAAHLTRSRATRPCGAHATNSRKVLASLPTYEEMLTHWAEVFREAAGSPAPLREGDAVRAPACASMGRNLCRGPVGSPSPPASSTRDRRSSAAQDC